MKTVNLDELLLGNDSVSDKRYYRFISCLSMEKISYVTYKDNNGFYHLYKENECNNYFDYDYLEGLDVTSIYLDEINTNIMHAYGDKDGSFCCNTIYFNVL